MSYKDHIQGFLGIANFTNLPDYAHIDFFCYGLNITLQSTLITDGP